jgi:nucleotide-binding universal stress UspA family protein
MAHRAAYSSLQMPSVHDRRDVATRLPAEPTPARPVILATLAVRVHPAAERMAIDSAIEAGVPLLVVNLIPLPLYVTTLVLVGPEGTTLPHEEGLDELRSTAQRAADLGVKTELLRVRTRHAVSALLEVAGERDAGLIVFGPDLGAVGRLRFRVAARRVRREAGCLVWIAPDG